MNQETVELVVKLKEWHQDKVKQLKFVTEAKDDTKIKVEDNNDKD